MPVWRRARRGVEGGGPGRRPHDGARRPRGGFRRLSRGGPAVRRRSPAASRRTERASRPVPPPPGGALQLSAVARARREARRGGHEGRRRERPVTTASRWAFRGWLASAGPAPTGGIATVRTGGREAGWSGSAGLRRVRGHDALSAGIPSRISGMSRRCARHGPPRSRQPTGPRRTDTPRWRGPRHPRRRRTPRRPQKHRAQAAARRRRPPFARIDLHRHHQRALHGYALRPVMKPANQA